MDLPTGQPSPPSVWVHGASAGDQRALSPLVSALREGGEVEVRVTAFTTTGRSMGTSLFGHRFIGRPPLPLGPFVDRFLNRHKPRLCILEYLELYPAWIMRCLARGLEIGVVDGKVGPRSLRIARLLAPSARHLSFFCAQTEADAEGASRLGVPDRRITVCGNGKHDADFSAPPQPTPDLRAAVGAVDVVIGSLFTNEERPFIEALKSRLPSHGLRVLLAPRYPDRAGSIARRARRAGLKVALRSEGPSPDAQLVVLDTLGELAAAYALAPVALIGGVFSRRGSQNLVEAAAHGCVLICGPNVSNVELEIRALDGETTFRAETFAHALDAASSWAGPREPARHQAALRRLSGATARHLTVLAPFLARAAVPWYCPQPIFNGGER